MFKVINTEAFEAPTQDTNVNKTKFPKALTLPAHPLKIPKFKRKSKKNKGKLIFQLKLKYLMRITKNSIPSQWLRFTEFSFPLDTSYLPGRTNQDLSFSQLGERYDFFP